MLLASLFLVSLFGYAYLDVQYATIKLYNIKPENTNNVFYDQNHNKRKGDNNPNKGDKGKRVEIVASNQKIWKIFLVNHNALIDRKFHIKHPYGNKHPDIIKLYPIDFKKQIKQQLKLKKRTDSNNNNSHYVINQHPFQSKPCLFSGTAIDENGQKSLAAFNVCNKGSGLIIGESNVYIFKPVEKPGKLEFTHYMEIKPLVHTWLPNKPTNISRVGHGKNPFFGTNLIRYKREKIASSPKYVIEMTIFSYAENGEPGIDDILTVALMTDRILQHSSIGIKIRLKINAINYIDAPNTVLKPYSGVETALINFNKYLKEFRKVYTNNIWDVAAYLSPAVSGFGDPTGFAYTGSICNMEENGYVSDYFGLGSSTTFTHELGHVLGAHHDEGFGATDTVDCEFLNKNGNRGIMGHYPHYKERYTWSKCSAKYIKETLESNGSCLLIEGKGDSFLKKEYFHLPRRFCQDLCHTTYPKYFCDYQNSNCMDMYCINPDNNYNDSLPSVVDNVYCLNGKLYPSKTEFVCKQGRCISIYDYKD